MAGEFDQIQLGEVASVRSGFAFKSSDWTESGIPVVKISNVKGGRLEMDGCSFVSQEIANHAPDARLSVGDILIAMTGYIGDVALVRDDNLPAALNQRVGRFDLRDKKRLDRQFLFYVLRNPEVRQEIERLGYGSAQPNVSPTLIHGARIPLPSIPQQRAIAHILGTLDYRIEANRRMASTLEEMARTLFRAWFVTFEPVRAKAEGRWRPGQTIPGLPASLYDAFPDRLIETEHGEIPKGWDFKPLSGIAEFLNGLALQKFPATNLADSLPVIKIAELRNGVSAKCDRASRALPPQYIVNNGDFIFSWSGSLLAKFWTEGEGALNQHLFKVTSQRYPAWFLSEWVQHHLEEFQRIASFKATTMGHIQRGHLDAAMTCCPPDQIIARLGSFIAPLVSRTVLTALETHNLTALRDTLLPKLVSGAMRVKDAEAFLKARGL